MKWEILGKDLPAGKASNVVKTLLKNRGIKDSKEFFDPKPPKLQLNFNKIIKRLNTAKKNKEKVIVYGDYDADGICATAILWEALHKYGLDVLPHIPDRFEEGYGLNSKGVENVKLQIPNVKLIITVDNGIVAYEGIQKAKKLGIDVIVIDHHAKGPKPLPIPIYYILHTTSVCGSALAYFTACELGYMDGLDLAAIGTIADQMPLTGVNRSLVKYGLVALSNTKRIGLKTLFSDSKIENIGTYEVNYIIAPRLNAMGRLSRGIESLRLLCTTRLDKAQDLSRLLSKTNFERQEIVQSVIINTKKLVTDSKVIVIAHESYHEGVIGLAAGKLTEEFYRPSIVISIKGDTAKASARSISGFNIIDAIRKTKLILEGGGHPMAAGFSINTSKIEEFTKKINEIANEILTDEILEKKLKIDLEINFQEIDPELAQDLARFAPFGIGNPTPTFASRDVEILESKPVGREAKHLKLKLKQGNKVLDGIFFNVPVQLLPFTFNQCNIAYCIEQNTWNGITNLQLKIKDINP